MLALAMFLATSLVHAQSHAGSRTFRQCPPEVLANMQNGGFPKGWARLYRSTQPGRACDFMDGAVGEGYSEAIIATLVGSWETLPVATRLGQQDVRFERFILDGVNAMAAAKDLHRIATLAASSCPSGSEALCFKLKTAAMSALKEQKKQ